MTWGTDTWLTWKRLGNDWHNHTTGKDEVNLYKMFQSQPVDYKIESYGLDKKQTKYQQQQPWA